MYNSNPKPKIKTLLYLNHTKYYFINPLNYQIYRNFWVTNSLENFNYSIYKFLKLR